MEKLDREKGKWEGNSEVMQVPEILIERERGLEMIFVVLQEVLGGWDSFSNEQIAQKAREYFSTNPLDDSTGSIFRSLANQDQEAFFWVAAAYGNSSRGEQVIEAMKKYKSHVRDPEEFFKEASRALSLFSKNFQGSDFERAISGEVEKDRTAREERKGDLQKRLQEIVEFFKPKEATSHSRKLLYPPVSIFQKESSGQNIVLPDAWVVVSHVENELNFDHEFLHGIINPIVDKLIERLSSDQERAILELTSGSLKRGYGSHAYSIICEELIRTFSKNFQPKQALFTAGEFSKMIKSMDDEAGEAAFNKNFLEENGFGEECEEMGVESFREFKPRAEEYFRRFKKSELSRIIFDLYNDFEDSREKFFEDFVIEELPRKIKT